MVNYIKQAKNINKKYTFNKVIREYKVVDKVDTKKKLDNLNLDINLLKVVKNDKESLQKIIDYIDKINYNNKIYSQYMYEYNNNYNMLLEEAKKLKFSFKKIKIKIFTIPLCDKYYRKKPPLSFNIKMFVSYTSPKKRVYRTREKAYKYLEFMKLYKENERSIQSNKGNTKVEIIKRGETKNQKLAGSSKQRFLILQRDKFRCVCCKKRGGEDGVKLYIHYARDVVDDKRHMKDFQTLCTDCIKKNVKYSHHLHELEQQVIEDIIDITYKEYKEKYLPSNFVKWDEDKQKRLKENELKRKIEVVNRIKSSGIEDENEIIKLAKDEWTSGQRVTLVKKDKNFIKSIDNYTCQLCGRTEEDNTTLVVDHIFPVARGGKSEIKNLQTLCKECNLGKRDRVLIFNKYTLENINVQYEKSS